MKITKEKIDLLVNGTRDGRVYPTTGALSRPSQHRGFARAVTTMTLKRIQPG
jgi:hypothetical protein